MAFIRKNINLLFVFILPVYFYIVQNSIQNKHTHVYANGIVVTHSHPLSNAEDGNASGHDHSQHEICLYSGVNFDLFELPKYVDFKVKQNEVCNHYFIYNEQAHYVSNFSLTIPRGPPTV